MDRHPVLVHYHIFKNAGSSVDFILKKSFGAAWGQIDGPHPYSVLTADDLREYLESHPNIKAVSSHQARPPLPWPQCKPVIFLRHPIERAYSVFKFVSLDGTQFNHELARSQGFPGYVEWALGDGRRKGGMVIVNYQTSYLINRASIAKIIDGFFFILEAQVRKVAPFFERHYSEYFTRGPSKYDLRKAKDFISNCEAFGIVRWFDASASLFQKLYSPSFPELRFENVCINRTGTDDNNVLSRLQDTKEPLPVPNEDDALDEIRKILGSKLYERLEKENGLDIELYAFAKGRFKELCDRNGIEIKDGQSSSDSLAG